MAQAPTEAAFVARLLEVLETASNAEDTIIRATTDAGALTQWITNDATANGGMVVLSDGTQLPNLAAILEDIRDIDLATILGDAPLPVNLGGTGANSLDDFRDAAKYVVFDKPQNLTDTEKTQFLANAGGQALLNSGNVLAISAGGTGRDSLSAFVGDIINDSLFTAKVAELVADDVGEEADDTPGITSTLIVENTPPNFGVPNFVELTYEMGITDFTAYDEFVGIVEVNNQTGDQGNYRASLRFTKQQLLSVDTSSSGIHAASTNSKSIIVGSAFIRYNTTEQAEIGYYMGRTSDNKLLFSQLSTHSLFNNYNAPIKLWGITYGGGLNSLSQTALNSLTTRSQLNSDQINTLTNQLANKVNNSTFTSYRTETANTLTSLNGYRMVPNALQFSEATRELSIHLLNGTIHRTTIPGAAMTEAGLDLGELASALTEGSPVMLDNMTGNITNGGSIPRDTSGAGWDTASLIATSARVSLPLIKQGQERKFSIGANIGITSYSGFSPTAAYRLVRYANAAGGTPNYSTDWTETDLGYHDIRINVRDDDADIGAGHWALQVSYKTQGASATARADILSATSTLRGVLVDEILKLINDNAPDLPNIPPDLTEEVAANKQAGDRNAEQIAAINSDPTLNHLKSTFSTAHLTGSHAFYKSPEPLRFTLSQLVGWGASPAAESGLLDFGEVSFTNPAPSTYEATSPTARQGFVADNWGLQSEYNFSPIRYRHADDRPLLVGYLRAGGVSDSTKHPILSVGDEVIVYMSAGDIYAKEFVSAATTTTRTETYSLRTTSSHFSAEWTPSRPPYEHGSHEVLFVVNNAGSYRVQADVFASSVLTHDIIESRSYDINIANIDTAASGVFPAIVADTHLGSYTATIIHWEYLPNYHEHGEHLLKLFTFTYETAPALGSIYVAVSGSRQVEVPVNPVYNDRLISHADNFGDVYKFGFSFKGYGDIDANGDQSAALVYYINGTYGGGYTDQIKMPFKYSSITIPNPGLKLLSDSPQVLANRIALLSSNGFMQSDDFPKVLDGDFELPQPNNDGTLPHFDNFLGIIARDAERVDEPRAVATRNINGTDEEVELQMVPIGKNDGTDEDKVYGVNSAGAAVLKDNTAGIMSSVERVPASAINKYAASFPTPRVFTDANRVSGFQAAANLNVPQGIHIDINIARHKGIIFFIDYYDGKVASYNPPTYSRGLVAYGNYQREYTILFDATTPINTANVLLINDDNPRLGQFHFIGINEVMLYSQLNSARTQLQIAAMSYTRSVGRRIDLKITPDVFYIL